MDSGAASWLIPLLEIVWIDIILSGDNAVVIALACRSLPPGQRTWGIVLGSTAAVLLRIIFTFAVVELLNLPYVKIASGALLLWIAVALVDEDQEAEVAPAMTLWESIRVIVIADAVMSLDNVMAIAAAAKGSNLLIIFGLALSIPFIIFGSSVMLALLTQIPALVWAGAALLGWIAGDLIAADPDLSNYLRGRAGLGAWGAPIGAAFVLAAAWLRNRLKEASKGA
ncbi:TerC family protein [Methylocapsa acidiphila]|uniref:TerC family protein n=1 Tax=Methylocapsa acidiphila TaxID=133552 RepID=UPI00041C4658|nr:TerC family protein [Methylocapsa acidiphila]